MATFDENAFMSLIQKVLKLDPRKSTIRMGETPAWDSVAHVDLIFQLEAAFNVSFDFDKISELDTPDKIRAAIKEMI